MIYRELLHVAEPTGLWLWFEVFCSTGLSFVLTAVNLRDFQVDLRLALRLTSLCAVCSNRDLVQHRWARQCGPNLHEGAFITCTIRNYL